MISSLRPTLAAAEPAHIKTPSPEASRSPFRSLASPKTSLDTEQKAEGLTIDSPDPKPHQTVTSKRGRVELPQAVVRQVQALQKPGTSVKDRARESSTTVRSGQERPRHIIAKQDEFDLASVLFAPLNTPASSSSSKRRNTKQPLGRSQSSHEIGARLREIDTPESDTKIGKKVTFKEEIMEIREAAEDPDRSRAADTSHDMSLRSSSSHEICVTRNREIGRYFATPLAPSRAVHAIEVVKGDITAMKNTTSSVVKEAVQNNDHRDAEVGKATDAGDQQSETGKQAQESEEDLPVISKSYDDRQDIKTDDSEHRLTAGDSKVTYHGNDKISKAEMSSGQTLNPDIQRSWTEKKKDTDRQMEGNDSDDQDDEKSLIIDESLTTQQQSDNTETGINTFKTVEAFPDKATRAYKTDRVQKASEGENTQLNNNMQSGEGAENPENGSKLKETNPLRPVETSKQTSHLCTSMSANFGNSTSKTSSSSQEQHERPSQTTNGPASASAGCRSTSVLPETGSNQDSIKDEQKKVGERFPRPIVKVVNTTPIPQPPESQQLNYTTNSTTHPAHQFIASGPITHHFLSSSYFQRSSANGQDRAANPHPPSCLPQKMVPPQASVSIQDKPQVLFLPGNTQATLPRQGTCGPISWPRSAVPLQNLLPQVWGGGYQAPAAASRQYQPAMVTQSVPNRKVAVDTGHQVALPKWQGQGCPAVRFLQPSAVVPGPYQPVRYVIYKHPATGAGASVLSSSQQAASSVPVPANLHTPVHVPPPVPKQVVTVTLAQQQQQQPPRPLRPKDSPPPPPPPQPPPPQPSKVLSKQSPPPPPPTARLKQSLLEKAAPQQTFGGNHTKAKPPSKPSPASVIPNGTLFIQTPKGLVQLQRQHRGDQTPSLSSSSHHYKLLPKPTDAKPAALSKQIQGRLNLTSVPKSSLPPRDGKDVSLQSVTDPRHTQASRAWTVNMKPGQTTGIRLPFPMLSQKQLVHLTSKCTSQQKTVQESRQEISTAVFNNKSQTGPQSEKLFTSNKQNASQEVSDEKGVKDGIVTAATSKATTQAEKKVKVNDYHKGSKTKSVDKERPLCSQYKKSAGFKENPQHQPGIVKGSLSQGRYVKFLDSSVTVNCIYVPTTQQSASNSKDVDSQQTPREQEPSPAFPLKTASLENMDLPLREKEVDVEEVLGKLSSNDSDTLSEDTMSSHGDDDAETKNRSEDEDDKKDEWRPSVPVKVPSKCTRRFRNPLTGGLSKINIQTSSRRRSGKARSSGEKEDCVAKIGKGHKASAANAISNRYDFRTGRTKHQTSITDKLSSLGGEKINFGTHGKEANFENQGSPAFYSVEDDDTLSSRPSSSSSNDDKTSPKSSKKEKVNEDHSTNEPINKEFPERKISSPSKRLHLRSSKSQGSDSDTLLPKHSKRVSFGNSDSSESPENVSKERVPFRKARRNLRRMQDRKNQSHQAPLWQKVLRMLGLKKKKKPACEGPPGGTPWHKRRSSSVVLAESLAESAKRLERNKEAKNDAEDEKPSITEAVSSPAKTKNTKSKFKTPKKEKKIKDRDAGGTQSEKKEKCKTAKKKPKRRKFTKKTKVSPQSFTDPASGSLTSIDFDARRQTRSKARREEDSASVSSYSQVDSSPSSSIRRGRKTLASFSAQAWEDCYRCTYLKWKEAEISPEHLAKDEGFKVMTNELGTPRGGSSKDKSFQKLLMSKWVDIVQSAQTGSLGEVDHATIKTELQVTDDPVSRAEQGAESIFVDTPPVAAEFSVCTSNPAEPYFQGIQTDNAWMTDTNVSTDANFLKLEDSITSQDDKQVAVDTQAKDNNPTESSECSSHQEDLVADSYGMPPVLSPIQDVTDEPVSQPQQQVETFETLEDAKAAGFIISEALTTEMLQLLAEDGSIDPDLSGVQAFALFMPNVDEEDDLSGDRGLLSEPSQTEDGVSCDDNEVPPVISFHRLDDSSDIHGGSTKENEARGVDVSRTLEDKRSIPLTEGSELDGFVDKQPTTTTELVQEEVCETNATSAMQEDCCLATDAMAGADTHHDNTIDDATFLKGEDSLNVSLEEGEIIDDDSRELATLKVLSDE